MSAIGSGLSKPPALPVVSADLTGKTVLLTGANTGIGYEACKHFATMNPKRLIMACRDASKGDAALKKIQEDTGYTNAEVWIVDFKSFASVSAFADKALSELDRLDIVVENAGISFKALEITEDGWEAALQVNYLGVALLALRLLPLLAKTSGAPRIVLLGSELFLTVKIDQEIVASPSGVLKTYNGPQYTTPQALATRYGLTKLLIIYLTRTLQSHIAAAHSHIIVTCVTPGFCYSELRRDLPEAYRAQVQKLEAEFAYTAEEGSRQLIYASVGGKDVGDSFRGAYIHRLEVSPVGEFVGSELGLDAEKRVWEETLEIMEGVDAKVANVTKMYLK